MWDRGIDAFAEAFTRGQYRHADGCFYGGIAPSWSRTVLEQVTAAEMFANAERIAVVDLHTGLGPYGYGELINDHPPGTAGEHGNPLEHVYVKIPVYRLFKYVTAHLSPRSRRRHPLFL